MREIVCRLIKNKYEYLNKIIIRNNNKQMHSVKLIIIIKYKSKVKIKVVNQVGGEKLKSIRSILLAQTCKKNI